MTIELTTDQAVWAAQACHRAADVLDRLANRIEAKGNLSREMKRDRDKYREIYSAIHAKIEIAMDDDLATQTRQER